MSDDQQLPPAPTETIALWLDAIRTMDAEVLESFALNDDR